MFIYTLLVTGHRFPGKPREGALIKFRFVQCALWNDVVC